MDEDDSGTSSSGTSVSESSIISYGNPRASRNMAEKQRRDNLNTNISTMAALVPIVAGSSRRMDKISILRLAAAFLRTQYILGRRSTNFLPRQFNEFDLEQYFVDHIVDSGGFFLVVTATGKIVYVSRQVEQHLGHVQNELLGQSLYNFVYPEDHDELTRNLRPDDIQTSATPSPTGVTQVSDLVHDNNSSSSEDSTVNHNRVSEKKKLFHEQRRNFKIRMAQRTVSRREHTQYESFDISGVLRLAEACKNADANGNRGRHREMTGTSNDIVFTGVATLPKKRPITELSIMDANKDEYVTRHLVDGRIIYCDHRVSVVAGYMSEEVSGLNAFAFMHKDDFRWTMIGLRQMYDRAEPCGSSCYRLLTKTGEFIYLRTHGYLEYDKDTQTVESFVCVNTLVSEQEGIQLIQEMKRRFSATVNTASKNLLKNIDVNSVTELQDSNSQSSNPRCAFLEEAAQLEDAISHLISDLPSPAVSEEQFSSSPMQHTQYVKAAIISSRMPPVSAQVNKIGINKIGHYVTIQNNGNQTPKQENKEHKYTNIGKYMNCSSAEQSPISDSESTKSSNKSLSMLDMMNGVHNNHNNVQNTDVSGQSNTRKPNTNRCRNVSRNHTSYMDVSQNVNGLNAQERIEQRNMLSPSALHKNNIKLECGIETFNHQKQESQYFDDSASDSSIISTQGIETHNRCMLKRVCSDEDVPTMHSKKRSNDVLYTSTNANDEQQCVSYVNCANFATENKYSTVEFNRHNDVKSQPLITAKSSNSSLENEVGTEYQQLIDAAAPLVVTSPDKKQFDLQDDTFLNSDLNTKDFIKKYLSLHSVHNGSVDFENRFNEALQQLASDHQRAINNKLLRHTYRQITNNLTLQETQINMLANNLRNPGLHAQRENLSQLQVEHSKQTKMIKTLQQDHHKIQVNAKHNLGI